MAKRKAKAAKKTGARKILARKKKKVVAGRKPKVTLKAQEVSIENVKFYTGQKQEEIKPAMPRAAVLPRQYGKDKIVLQVRDPWWLYAYWELTPQTIQRLKDELKGRFHRARFLLRVYDISHIIFNGNNAHRFFDIYINDYADNWYIDTNGPGRSWCVDLGLLLADGSFITVLRSNTVHTPLDGPSWIIDEEWMIPEESFARLYGMGFGFGRSSPIGKAWQERVKKALFSGALFSRK